MEGLIKDIISVITDKTRSIGYKFSIFLSIIGLLVLTDLLIGFTFNYHVNNFLTQLSKIQELKKQYLDDSTRFNQLLSIEDDIFSRRHYSQVIYDIFDNLTIKSRGKYVHEEEVKISLFWMVFSSSFTLIWILPVILIMPIIPGVKFDSRAFIGWLAFVFIYIVTITVITALFYQIPLINKSKPYYNYILNFIIHLIFAFVIIYSLRKKINDNKRLRKRKP